MMIRRREIRYDNSCGPPAPARPGPSCSPAVRAPGCDRSSSGSTPTSGPSSTPSWSVRDAPAPDARPRRAHRAGPKYRRRHDARALRLLLGRARRSRRAGVLVQPLESGDGRGRSPSRPLDLVAGPRGHGRGLPVRPLRRRRRRFMRHVAGLCRSPSAIPDGSSWSARRPTRRKPATDGSNREWSSKGGRRAHSPRGPLLRKALRRDGTGLPASEAASGTRSSWLARVSAIVEAGRRTLPTRSSASQDPALARTPTPRATPSSGPTPWPRRPTSRRRSWRHPRQLAVSRLRR